MPAGLSHSQPPSMDSSQTSARSSGKRVCAGLDAVAGLWRWRGSGAPRRAQATWYAHVRLGDTDVCVCLQLCIFAVDSRNLCVNIYRCVDDRSIYI